MSLLKNTTRQRQVSNPRPLAPEEETLPLGQSAPHNIESEVRHSKLKGEVANWSFPGSSIYSIF